MTFLNGRTEEGWRLWQVVLPDETLTAAPAVVVILERDKA